MTGGAYRPVEGYTVTRFDTASADAAFLVTVPGGRRWQVNAATAELLEVLSESESLEDAAATLSGRWRQPVTPEALRAYLDRTLVASGMVRGGDGRATAPAGGAPTRMASLRLRTTLVPERVLRPLSAVAAWAFHPVLFAPGALAALLCLLWIVMGDAPAAGAGWLAAALTPGAVVLLIGSTFAHELGHAAACRRFGCRHGALGFGIYLVFPVLFMEVHESWALRRWQRVIVDLGGLYLQLLFGVLAWLAAGLWPALEPAAYGAAVLIAVSLVVNLNPFLRLDGYWVLSDALGVPNLRRRSTAILSAAVNRARGRTQVAAASGPGFPPRVTAALGAYAGMSLLFFVFFFGRLALELPGFLTVEYPALLALHLGALETAVAQGMPAAAAAALVSLVPPTALVVALPLIVLRPLVALAAAARRQVAVAPLGGSTS